ncbi:hypothetical protein BC835DRAFT_1310717 [Cytidiella melzeri]|nr:hypothetical protein BC835DRAFT_1310717 [Cytidiella melzeri]
MGLGSSARLWWAHGAADAQGEGTVKEVAERAERAAWRVVVARGWLQVEQLDTSEHGKRGERAREARRDTTCFSILAFALKFDLRPSTILVIALRVTTRDSEARTLKVERSTTLPRGDCTMLMLLVPSATLHTLALALSCSSAFNFPATPNKNIPLSLYLRSKATCNDHLDALMPHAQAPSPPPDPAADTKKELERPPTVPSALLASKDGVLFGIHSHTINTTSDRFSWMFSQKARETLDFHPESPCILTKTRICLKACSCSAEPGDDARDQVSLFSQKAENMQWGTAVVSYVDSMKVTHFPRATPNLQEQNITFDLQERNARSHDCTSNMLWLATLLGWRLFQVPSVLFSIWLVVSLLGTGVLNVSSSVTISFCTMFNTAPSFCVSTLASYAPHNPPPVASTPPPTTIGKPSATCGLNTGPALEACLDIDSTIYIVGSSTLPCASHLVDIMSQVKALSSEASDGRHNHSAQITLMHDRFSLAEKHSLRAINSCHGWWNRAWLYISPIFSSRTYDICNTPTADKLGEEYTVVLTVTQQDLSEIVPGIHRQDKLYTQVLARLDLMQGVVANVTRSHRRRCSPFPWWKKLLFQQSYHACLDNDEAIAAAAGSRDRCTTQVREEKAKLLRAEGFITELRIQQTSFLCDVPYNAEEALSSVALLFDRICVELC